MTNREMPTLTRRRGRNESGSAFVTVLLVLVVLTFIGLGLSLVTESEVAIGWNERLATRMLYAADSGIAIGTSRRHGEECSPIEVNLATAMPGSEPAVSRLSAYLPINNAPCNLCDVQTADTSGSYQDLYQRVNHLIEVQAMRTTDTEAADFGYASHAVRAMVDLQPFTLKTDCYKQGEFGGTIGIRN